MLNLTKKIALHASVYYSVCTVVYTLIFIALGGEQPHAYRLLMLSLFAMLFAWANCFFGLEKYSFSTRVITHYILTVSGLYLGTILPTVIGNHTSARTAFIMMLLYTVVYCIIMVPVCIISSRSRKNKSKSTGREYTSIYAKKKK